MNQLLLQLPDTAADLLGGNLGAAALTKAILYYVVLGLMSFVAVAGQVQAQSHGVKRARDSVWKKMLGMRMEYFDRNDPSDLMSAIINDSGNAVNDMVNIIVNLIPGDCAGADQSVPLDSGGILLCHAAAEISLFLCYGQKNAGRHGKGL